jgi:hypothetical protein
VGGRQGLEPGNLHKKLGDQNENVKIESDDGTDDISAAPWTGQMKDAQGRNRHRQNKQRDDANGAGRQKICGRKQESVHAGQNRGRKKERGPAVASVSRSGTRPRRRIPKGFLPSPTQWYEGQYRHIEYHERISVRGGLSKSDAHQIVQANIEGSSG